MLAYLCKAIRWDYNGNSKMLSELLHNANMKCLEVCCSTHSALAIALLLSPTAITTSTNIHLFYNVFLMEHINCLCCCLGCYSFIHFSCVSFLNLFLFLDNAVSKLHTHIFTQFTVLLLF